MLIFAGVMFFRNMTGRVVLDNNNDSENNTVNSENESYDRNINNYDIVNKSPKDLNEKECTLLEDGRKLCMVKRGAKVTAGVTDET